MGKIINLPPVGRSSFEGMPDPERHRIPDADKIGIGRNDQDVSRGRAGRFNPLRVHFGSERSGIVAWNDGRECPFARPAEASRLCLQRAAIITLAAHQQRSIRRWRNEWRGRERDAPVIGDIHQRVSTLIRRRCHCSSLAPHERRSLRSVYEQR